MLFTSSASHWVTGRDLVCLRPGRDATEEKGEEDPFQSKEEESQPQIWLLEGTTASETESGHQGIFDSVSSVVTTLLKKTYRSYQMETPELTSGSPYTSA